jgi:hypothetical protein
MYSSWRSLRSQNVRLAIVAALVLVWGALNLRTAAAVDDVVFKQDGKTTHVSGKAVVSASDGGVMVLAPDGKLWPIMPENVIEHHQNDNPFAILPTDEFKKHILAELPAGFETYSTGHYLICYNTSRGYAQWCGALFERLYSSFRNFWTQRGFKLQDPATPLVVVIYATRETYTNQSAEELKGRAGVIGYYSLQTNWVKTYDLTGAEELRQGGDNRRMDATQINQLLSRPEAALMVSTVIHEATHQITFNCGLQQRFADIPLWVCEGLAEYFETPDLNYGKGWRTIGEVNPPRIARFQQYLSRRPINSLSTLLADDKRFRSRDGEQMLDAYAEAWAFNYFLWKQHPKQYQAYLQRMSEKAPLAPDTPVARLAEFKDSFGDDLAALDAEFVRYMVRVK